MEASFWNDFCRGAGLAEKETNDEIIFSNFLRKYFLNIFFYLVYQSKDLNACLIHGDH